MRQFLSLLLPQLGLQLNDELPEDEGGHVVGQEVQQSPVTELELVGHIVKNVADSLLMISKDRTNQYL